MPVDKETELLHVGLGKESDESDGSVDYLINKQLDLLLLRLEVNPRGRRVLWYERDKVVDERLVLSEGENDPNDVGGVRDVMNDDSAPWTAESLTVRLFWQRRRYVAGLSMVLLVGRAA